jgi:hypothetical protein
VVLRPLLHIPVTHQTPAALPQHSPVQYNYTSEDELDVCGLDALPYKIFRTGTFSNLEYKF